MGREGQRSPFLSVLDYILLCGRLLEDSTQDYTDGSVKVLRNGRGGGGALTDWKEVRDGVIPEETASSKALSRSL